VWAFAAALDLRDLHDAVKAREGVPGQAPPAHELMMALWLWATVDGVGSARQLAKLCQEHLAYRWLCGGVSMNYHTLSDFRVAHATLLERLLTNGVAALVAAGLVALDVLAQDGLRVRAAAGAGSPEPVEGPPAPAIGGDPDSGPGAGGAAAGRVGERPGCG
jgi:hypothetical protein